MSNFLLKYKRGLSIYNWLFYYQNYIMYVFRLPFLYNSFLLNIFSISEISLSTDIPWPLLVYSPGFKI